MKRYDQCDETCTVDCGHCKGNHEATFELKLSNGKRVMWTGYDGIDAARRYVDAHMADGYDGIAVIAWRYPRVSLTVGIPEGA
jgi:hypothetical protein